ncbi:MAG: hypothetical protein GY941_06975 [Planctomycetes bacterium]|nr:hypothetical protein [Planctomycetota bacterium]
MGKGYNKKQCNVQYDKCLRSHAKHSGERITLNTFFAFCSEINKKIEGGGDKSLDGNPYRVDDNGCLYRIKGTKDGGIPIKLANFTAEIREEIIRDDGLETTQNYHIEGTMNGRKLSSIDIPAISFCSMNWLYRWGTQAVMEPGQSVKDYVRHHTQLNSNTTRKVCYTHTGWREVDNEWFYLTGNGAIGATNLLVELTRENERYQLPTAVINETAAINASLSFLDIGDKNVTYPLFATNYLSPLTTLLNPMPNFVVYLLGETGLFKTSLATLMLSHFGDFLSVTALPNFSDTSNLIEKRAFILKDAPMVLDDYHPSAQKGEAMKNESTAQRIIRAYSNRTARGRLNRDCSDKGQYTPRGMLTITGEEIVTLQSTIARLAVVEVEKGSVDRDKLTEIQGKADLLPHAMVSYISWVKENRKSIQDNFKQRFIELRKKASDEGVHSKLPEQVAFLTFAFETTLSWLVENGVIGETKAEQMSDEGWDVFMHLAALQAKRINCEDPILKFKEIIQTLIDQDKVKLRNKTPDCLDKTIGGNDGELIGYYDDSFFYFLPPAMWRRIQMFCRDEGSHFSFMKNTFYRTLAKRGMLETKNGDNVIPCTIEGKTKRVLKVYRNKIEDPTSISEKNYVSEGGNYA